MTPLVRHLPWLIPTLNVLILSENLSINCNVPHIHTHFSFKSTNAYCFDFIFQVTLCCVVWSASVCWMSPTWSSITCWVWKSKISWSVVSKPRCSNWDWPSPSIMHVCWSVKDTSGKYNNQLYSTLTLTGMLNVWHIGKRKKKHEKTENLMAAQSNGAGL